MAVEKVLLSFVGFQDPVSPKTKEDGPILSVLSEKAEAFSRITLFHTPDFSGKAEETCEAVSRRFPQLTVSCHRLDIEDPTRYESILNALRQVYPVVCPYSNGRNFFEYYISIASGTPQMHACWLLLAASGEISANIFHIREKRQVKPGQPLITEINPRVRAFPVVQTRITMEEIPEISQEDMDLAIDEVGLIGGHPAFREAMNQAIEFARYDEPVLLTGESGTGKELFAQFIRVLSKRADRPFLPVNCAAISPNLVESELFGHEKGSFTGAVRKKKGHFELAHGGTIFLDEIGEMPIEQQAKLMRVLENGEITPVGGETRLKVDVRIIAATNRNLKEAIKDGSFRNDLFYRLDHLIQLPALRDRPEDIPALANIFVHRHNKKYRKDKILSHAAAERLKRHTWPGNVRELRNVISRAAIRSRTDTIEPEDIFFSGVQGENPYAIELPPLIEGEFKWLDFQKACRRLCFEKAMSLAGGNMSKAAKLLGISPQQVSEFFKKSED